MNRKNESSQYGRKLLSAGFTLIELLIVIGVIVVLALLIVPAVGRVKRSANRTVDVGNMRNIGMAIQQFQMDYYDGGRIFLAHDDYADRYGLGYQAWPRLLKPYLGYEMIDYYQSVPSYISPGDPTHGGATTRYSAPIYSDFRRSYSFNIKTLDTYQNTYTWRKSQIRNPSQFLFFADHRAALLNTLWIDPLDEASMDAVPDDWFDGGLANFAFLDGHIESIKVSDVKSGGSRHQIFYPTFNQ